jgi:hypothetical protein
MPSRASNSSRSARNGNCRVSRDSQFRQIKLHPLAKAAKDVSAGMVLIAAIASVGVGLLILGRPLWVKMFH